MLTLALPEMKPRSAKDVIFRELASARGMTVTELLKRARESGLNVSYHAVYQAAKELQAENILQKSENRYSISGKYVDFLRQYLSSLEEDFSEKVNLSMPMNSTRHFTFSSLNEATLFMAKMVYSNILGNITNRDVCMVFQHLWLIQTIKGNRYLSIVKKIARLNRWHILVQGNSLIDRKLKQAYERDFRAKIILGKKLAPFSNYAAYGDIVVESFIPKNLFRLQEKVYSSSRDRLDVDWIEKYTRLCYDSKYRISVTVTRNRELAQQIRQNILSEFGE